MILVTNCVRTRWAFKLILLVHYTCYNPRIKLRLVGSGVGGLTQHDMPAARPPQTNVKQSLDVRQPTMSYPQI